MRPIGFASKLDGSTNFLVRSWHDVAVRVEARQDHSGLIAPANDRSQRLAVRPLLAALRHWPTVGTNPRPFVRYFSCAHRALADVDLVAHWPPRSHGVDFQQAISSAGHWAEVTAVRGLSAKVQRSRARGPIHLRSVGWIKAHR